MSLENNYASRPNSVVSVKSIELIPSIYGGDKIEETLIEGQEIAPLRQGKLRIPGDTSLSSNGISTPDPNGRQWSSKTIPFCYILNDNSLEGTEGKAIAIVKIPLEVGRNTLGNYHHIKIIGYAMSTSSHTGVQSIQVSDGSFQSAYPYTSCYMFKADLPLTYKFTNSTSTENGFKPVPSPSPTSPPPIEALTGVGRTINGFLSQTPPNLIPQNLPPTILSNPNTPFITSVASQIRSVDTTDDSTPTSFTEPNIELKIGTNGNYNINNTVNGAWDGAQIEDDVASFDIVLTYAFTRTAEYFTIPFQETYWSKIKGLITLY